MPKTTFGIVLFGALSLFYVSAARADTKSPENTPSPEIFYIPVVPESVVTSTNKTKEVKIKEPLADKYNPASDTDIGNTSQVPEATEPRMTRSQVRKMPSQGEITSPNTAYENVNAPIMEFPKPDNHIFVKPGEPNILQIGQEHLNRIVTPFDLPKVHYMADTAWFVEIKGNTIYVTRQKTKAERATLALFITNGDDQTTALSITLWARNLPPKEYVLRVKSQDNFAQTGTDPGFLNGGLNPAVKGNEKVANRFEMENPFSSMVMDVMSAIAVGDIPSGYSLRQASFGDARPYCKTPEGVRTSFRTAQIMEGSNLQVFVGLVQNTNINPINLQEGWCATRDVRAVAFWPGPTLPAGGKAEIYVMRHTQAYINDLKENRRPSLIN